MTTPVPGGGWTPVPDPTQLTTEAVNAATLAYRRELAQLRELLETRIGALRELTESRTGALRVLLDERYATQTKALDAAFRAAEQAVAVALANAEKAVIKSENAADERFRSVNEFRKALVDQTNTFLPRIEYDTAHQALEDKISDARDRLTTIESLTRGIREASADQAGERTEYHAVRGQLSQTVIIVIMSLSVLIAIVSIIVAYLKK